MTAHRHGMPESIATPQDLSSLILELRDYAKWAAHVAAKKRLRLKHASEPPELSPTSKEVLRNWLTNRTISEENLGHLVSALEEFQSTAPSITLTLAAIPSNMQKLVLVSWCRENISPDVLVNFHCDRTILGGICVRYGSHIHDWSFRRAILTGRDKFPEVLHHV